MKMTAFTSRTQLLGLTYLGNQAILLGEIVREKRYTRIHNKAIENMAITRNSPKCSQYLVHEILLFIFFFRIRKNQSTFNIYSKKIKYAWL